jgi:hypothetical protein
MARSGSRVICLSFAHFQQSRGVRTLKPPLVIYLLNWNRYSKRTYQPGTETSGIFLTLLLLYLHPTVKSDLDLLRPALDLISRHLVHLGSTEALKLLPPLVTACDMREFLLESLCRNWPDCKPEE